VAELEVEQRTLAFVAHGADACGEKGEYHTLATAGPLFGRPLRIRLLDRHPKADCWFQDIELAD
jgi:diphthamide synthase (EF-2-diphthine--ammonia ligase)